jgi:hypothetical protein
VYLRQSMDGPGGENLNFSVPEINDFRGGVKSLGGIAEYSNWSITMRSDREAERVSVGLVTGNYFEVMGLSPVLGRVTRPSDDGPGVPAVMVLTHEFWMKRFGGDESIVGKQIKMDGGSATVIGVLQPAPTFPDKMDALMNMVVSKHHLSADGAESQPSYDRDGARLHRALRWSKPDRGRRRLRTCASQFKDAYDPGSHYR